VPSTDTGNGCLRSTGNYPSLVAAALPAGSFTDVSCSGADSTSLVGVQQTNSGPQPPQFDALGKRTNLVTLSIGGNDAGLFRTLVGTCSQLRNSDPGGSPCRDRLTAAGGDPVGTALTEIRGHVRAAVAGIRDRAPRATVVVVGYPQIVPASGNCPRLLPLAKGDYAYGRTINKGLADAVRLGARRADAYIDVFAASAGHDVCSPDPWINGSRTDPSRALAFHPFAEEQQAVADLVLDAL
jgi:lysophospholipase L1-like esterase